MLSLIVPPVFLFLLSQTIAVAVKTQTIMATDHAAAGRATPFLFFSFQEMVHPVLFDASEIVKEAHPE
jgi:hypothetical protein